MTTIELVRKELRAPSRWDSLPVVAAVLKKWGPKLRMERRVDAKEIQINKPVD